MDEVQPVILSDIPPREHYRGLKNGCGTKCFFNSLLQVLANINFGNIILATVQAPTQKQINVTQSFFSSIPIDKQAELFLKFRELFVRLLITLTESGGVIDYEQEYKEIILPVLKLLNPEQYSVTEAFDRICKYIYLTENDKSPFFINEKTICLSNCCNQLLFEENLLNYLSVGNYGKHASIVELINKKFAVKTTSQTYNCNNTLYPIDKNKLTIMCGNNVKTKVKAIGRLDINLAFNRFLIVSVPRTAPIKISAPFNLTFNTFDSKTNTNQIIKYEINSVIFSKHNEAGTQGHYWAYCWNKKLEKWILCDDSITEQIDDANNINHVGFDNIAYKGSVLNHEFAQFFLYRLTDT